MRCYLFLFVAGVSLLVCVMAAKSPNQNELSSRLSKDQMMNIWGGDDCEETEKKCILTTGPIYVDSCNTGMSYKITKDEEGNDITDIPSCPSLGTRGTGNTYTQASGDDTEAGDEVVCTQKYTCGTGSSSSKSRLEPYVYFHNQCYRCKTDDELTDDDICFLCSSNYDIQDDHKEEQSFCKNGE